MKLTEKELVEQLNLIRATKKKQKQKEENLKLDLLFNKFKDAVYLLHKYQQIDKDNIHQRIEVIKVNSCIKETGVNITGTNWELSYDPNWINISTFIDKDIYIQNHNETEYNIISEQEFNSYLTEWNTIVNFIKTTMSKYF